MAHDVFISYSSKDKPIADGICASLEADGIRCWIAPRDIAPGEDWPTAITKAISESAVMVLVFSASSNSSADVGREIILAANRNLVIIPFKIENIEPEPGKQYYLARTHWLEAMNPPTRQQIKTLVERVKSILPSRQPGIIVDQPPEKPAAVVRSVPRFPAGERRPFPWIWIWLAGVLVLILMAVIFWPKIQGMIAPAKATPTSAATATIQPTLTNTLTATATQTLIPSPTPTTGTVTGMVKWGDQPYEGVNMMLCSNWTGVCKGLAYNSITNSQGEYTISGVEPGKYQVIHTVAEQYGLIIPDDASDSLIVAAGETITYNIEKECKYDLKVSFLYQNGKVTLSWNKNPGGLSSLYVGNIYWSEGGEAEKHWISETTYSRTLEAGNYLWFVKTQGLSGNGWSCASSRFTIP